MVPFPVRSDSSDTLRNMTMIPYLEDFHDGVPSEEEEEYDENQIFQNTQIQQTEGNGTHPPHPQQNTHSMFITLTPCQINAGFHDSVKDGF